MIILEMESAADNKIDSVFNCLQSLDAIPVFLVGIMKFIQKILKNIQKTPQEGFMAKKVVIGLKDIKSANSRLISSRKGEPSQGITGTSPHVDRSCRFFAINDELRFDKNTIKKNLRRATAEK